MHPSSGLTQSSVAYGLPRVGASVALLLLGCWGVATLAGGLPGVIRQIARPCAGCYLGAFEPPLEPYGHPFRQADDTATGGQKPPVAMTVRTAFPGPRESQPGRSGRLLASSDAIAADQTSLFGAARIGQDAARFLGLNGGDMIPEFHAGGAGPGYAWAASRFEPDAVSGGSMHDGPTARDPWNAMPVWGVPDYRFNFTSTSGAAAIVDGSVRPSASGLGAGAPWYNARQTGLSGDRGAEYDVLHATGPGPALGTPGVPGSVPYWRVAVQKDLERHFLQIGTYGINATALPLGTQAVGTTDTFTDIGADANYQFIVDPGSAVSDSLAAQATLVHEARSLDAGNRLLGANGFNTFDAFRADASWRIGETVTPSIQYFRTSGSIGAVRYGWPGSRPNSAGVIAEVAYVPWGGPGSPVQFLNLRFAAQYVAYTEFNGTGRGAGGNNAVYLSLWGALHF
jgi:hypothetical protein